VILILSTSPEPVTRHLPPPHCLPSVGSFGWAFAIFCTAIVENVTQNIYFHCLYRMSMHLKVRLAGCVLRQSCVLGVAPHHVLVVVLQGGGGWRHCVCWARCAAACWPHLGIAERM
jgi:hypothetical protein